MAVGLDAPIDMSKADVNGDYQLTTYEYDFKNALIQTQDALGQAETYKTDMFGNVKEKTDRNGNWLTMTYNPYGQLDRQVIMEPDGDIQTLTNSYDIMGNLTVMWDSSGITRYEYDSFNRLTKETKGNIIKEYSYDALGNRKSFTLTNSSKNVIDTEYEYDKRNQLSSVINGSNTSSYTYDANGNMLTDTVNNLTTTYTYNNANLITNMANRLQSHSYAYNLDGNISVHAHQSIDGANIGTYVYDDMGRLVEEDDKYSNKDYTYDKYGNISSVKDYYEGTTTQRAYDKNNRLLNEVSTNGTATKYYYDRNGNTTAKNIMSLDTTGGETVSVGAFATAGTGVTLYNYNGLNQLVSMEENGKTSAYTYDGAGLRQSKTVDGVVTKHIWDGTNMVAETDGTNVINKYYRGANGIMYANLDGTITRYVKDGHGNVTGLTDVGATTLTKTYNYDAFGVEIDKDESDINPFRYCGEYYDNELDKIYLRARYYSPIQGRFMTEDPIKDGLNWYAYCSGDPVNYRDPSGLEGSKGYADCILYFSYLVDNKLSYEMVEADYYAGGSMYANEYGYMNTLNIYKDNAEMARNKILESDFLPEGLKQLTKEIFESDGHGTVKQVNAIIYLAKEYNDDVVSAAAKNTKIDGKSYEYYSDRLNELVTGDNANTLYTIYIDPQRQRRTLPRVKIDLNLDIARKWLKTDILPGMGPDYTVNGKKIDYISPTEEEMENNDEEIEP